MHLTSPHDNTVKRLADLTLKRLDSCIAAAAAKKDMWLESIPGSSKESISIPAFKNI